MSSERDPARRRADLAARWQRVNDMLADLAEGYTDPTASLDPTERERALLTELDRIEFELGELDRQHPNA